jgi:hypothetical protein
MIPINLYPNHKAKSFLPFAAITNDYAQNFLAVLCLPVNPI